MHFWSQVGRAAQDPQQVQPMSDDGHDVYEFGIRTSPPSLEELLADAGCNLFLEAMRKARRLDGADSITIIAPNDDAFHSGSRRPFSAAASDMVFPRRV